jgi:hypothetical protein
MIKDNTTSVETLDKISNILGVSPAIFFEDSSDTCDSNKVESDITAENLDSSLVGKNIHHNNINNSAVLMKALDEISEHRKLISESHKNLSELTKAVVNLINK